MRSVSEKSWFRVWAGASSRDLRLIRSFVTRAARNETRATDRDTDIYHLGTKILTNDRMSRPVTVAEETTDGGGTSVAEERVTE